MKSIVLITYYFPPCQGIASWRLFSFASSLYQSGYKVTVFTRQWSGVENTWSDHIKEGNQETHSHSNFGFDVVYIKQRHASWYKNSNPLKTLFNWTQGNFQPEQFHYNEFFNEINSYILINETDLLLSSSFPLFTHKLAYNLSIKYNLKYILDFRDTWNNESTNENSKIHLKRKIEDFFRRKYIKKWINNSLNFITLSSSFIDFFHENISSLSKLGISISNGFEKNKFEKLRVLPQSSTFIISVIGTIYPNQDLSPFINGFNAFVKNKNNSPIKLMFIGVESISEVSKKLHQKISEDYLITSAKIDRENALIKMSDSSILFYPGWKGYHGIYSGKIFEYLGMHRNLLIAPGDDDVLDDLLNKTKAGKIGNTDSEVKELLENWYLEWKNNGKLKYYGNHKMIDNYSRENQNQILLDYIEKTLI